MSLKDILHPFAVKAKSFSDKIKHSEYIKSDYCADMSRFKNTAKNKRCFIIGNGPSLTVSDLEMLKNEDCFACNRIYGLYENTDWRPKYYCAQDAKLIEQIKGDLPFAVENSSEAFLSYSFRKCYNDEVMNNPKTHLFYRPYVSVYSKDGSYPEGLIPFSDDAAIAVYDGLSITYGMIQIAVYMGYKEIYLLGIDHNFTVKNGVVDASKSYAQGIKPIDMKTQFPPALKLCEVSFREAKKYCEEHGIKIMNATRGGKLEVFDRVSLDDLVQEGYNS